MAAWRQPADDGQESFPWPPQPYIGIFTVLGAMVKGSLPWLSKVQTKEYSTCAVFSSKYGSRVQISRTMPQAILMVQTQPES